MGFLDLVRHKGRPKTPRDADALALRQLLGRGADLTQARHVIHFLYFAAEPDARAAAEVVQQAGWLAELQEPTEHVKVWTLRVDGTRVVSSATIESFRAWFEHVAAEHHGEYDGWEAAAKP